MIRTGALVSTRIECDQPDCHDRLHLAVALAKWIVDGEAHIARKLETRGWKRDGVKTYCKFHAETMR